MRKMMRGSGQVIIGHISSTCSKVEGDWSVELGDGEQRIRDKPSHEEATWKLARWTTKHSNHEDNDNDDDDTDMRRIRKEQSRDKSGHEIDDNDYGGGGDADMERISWP